MRSELNYGKPWQIGFQFPANDIMFGLINLHNHICFYLILIGIFTLYLLYSILKENTINYFSDLTVFSKVRKLYNIKINNNEVLEIIWVVIPTLILLSIAVPSFSLLYAMELVRESLWTVKVIGYQWYWSYEIDFNRHFGEFFKYAHYSEEWMTYLFIMNDPYRPKLIVDSYMVPDNDLNFNNLRLLEVNNALVLPVNTNIRILVTSNDVLHSWAVPALGIKVDACPGRLNDFILNIKRSGHFYGQCSELCGVNHGFMPIEIYAIRYQAFWDYYKVNVLRDIMSWCGEDIYSYNPQEFG